MANAPSVQQYHVRRKDMTIELGKIGGRRTTNELWKIAALFQILVQDARFTRLSSEGYSSAFFETANRF